MNYGQTIIGQTITGQTTFNIGDAAVLKVAAKSSARLTGIPAGTPVIVKRTMPSRYNPAETVALVEDINSGVQRWITTESLALPGQSLATGRTVTCSVCGQKGHNARRCRNTAQPAAQQAATVAAATPATPKTPATKYRDDWHRAETIIPEVSRVLLYGPPGTGKTTAGFNVGAPNGVVNLTLTEETPAAELRGHFVPKGGDFVWMDGPVTMAAREGKRLILDEIDHASTDALTFLLGVLNDPGMNSFTLPTGEKVAPAETFSTVATMNGELEDLSPALRSRFDAKIYIGKPHPDAIAKLPAELRKPALQSIESDPERSVTFREWHAFARLAEKLDAEIAAFAVFGNRAQDILNTIAIGGN